MKFEDKLKARSREDVWNEYCGFLDLSMDEFVQIQNRLMEEQIALWSRSPLGKKILKGSTPKNIKEFRGLVPLTSYDDYASDLLQKKSELLPDEPFYGSRQLGRVVNIPSRWPLILKVCWIHLNGMSVPVCYWELQQSEGILKPVRQIRFYMV